MLFLEIKWGEAQAIAAYVGAIVSIITIVWSLKNQKKIEILKNELAERKSEIDARRSYEYEARKRLYHEYEPLLFQLMEASDNALHRIQSLARTARKGDLGEKGWLSEFGYYTKSTIYKLFVPIAIYQIMQRKLTLVDVSIDRSIDLHYKLAKQIYLTYTDDFEFVKDSSESYAPNNRDWKELRKKDPKTYWRQGLPMGLLDKVSEFLIEKDDNGSERVISFGEFERKMDKDSSENQLSDINHVKDIFELFHPEQRPILWRLLITQACMFRCLLELKKINLSKIDDKLVQKILLDITPEFIKRFNWQDEKESNDKLINEPFDIAKEYLKKKF